MKHTAARTARSVLTLVGAATLVSLMLLFWPHWAGRTPRIVEDRIPMRTEGSREDGQHPGIPVKNQQQRHGTSLHSLGGA